MLTPRTSPSSPPLRAHAKDAELTEAISSRMRQHEDQQKKILRDIDADVNARGHAIKALADKYHMSAADKQASAQGWRCAWASAAQHACTPHTHHPPFPSQALLSLSGAE